MRLKPMVVGVSALLLADVLGEPALRAGGFRNADVLTMLKEGRPDSVITARIAEVQTAAIFAFETADLQALKDAGASLSVLSAMLAHARQSSGKSFGSAVMPAFKSLKAQTVTLVTAQGQQEIEMLRGERTIENLPRGYFAYPGPRASVRTTDPKPDLLIAASSDPLKQYYFLCRLVRSDKKDKRLLAIMYAVLYTVPLEGFSIPCTATQAGNGIWKLTPQADLEPGEYGLMDDARLFGFGIDPRQ